MNTVFCFILLISLGSCTIKTDCQNQLPEEVKLEQVNATIRFPEYEIVNSNRYGLNNLMRLELESLDSSLVMFIKIKTYHHDTARIGSFYDRFESRRESFGANIEKNEFLILDTIVKKKYTEVGLIKYNDEVKNRYEGLVFYFKDFKIIEISIFADKTRWRDGKILDCIFRSLRIN